MFRFLSHTIAATNPSYGSCKKNIELKRLRSSSAGDSCSTFWFSMENHLGTHIDCPAHFFDNGMKVVDYPADFWIFHKPQIIAVKAGPGEIISKEGLSEDVNPESDLLIFKSGWSKRRDEGEYCLRNPGIEPALGVWLRKSFPNIRALGIDWVSVSSYVHRDIGRKAHFEFLNPAGAGHPILLIEDMDIPEDLQSLNQIWALPLRVEELDSSPCTIIGVS